MPPQRARTLFAVAGALMTLGLVAGAVLLFGGRPTTVAPEALTSATTAPPPEATPAEVTAAPRRHPAHYRCWDDSVISRRQACGVSGPGAQFWAFGLDEGDCTPAGRVGRERGRWSYTCRIGRTVVHLGTFAAADRARVLAAYGPARSLGEGRVLAGGPLTPARRWIRTYDDAAAARGLLMFASVAAKHPRDERVLLDMQQRFAPYLLRGDLITTSG